MDKEEEWAALIAAAKALQDDLYSICHALHQRMAELSATEEYVGFDANGTGVCAYDLVITRTNHDLPGPFYVKTATELVSVAGDPTYKADVPLTDCVLWQRSDAYREANAACKGLL